MKKYRIQFCCAQQAQSGTPKEDKARKCDAKMAELTGLDEKLPVNPANQILKREFLCTSKKPVLYFLSHNVAFHEQATPRTAHLHTLHTAVLSLLKQATLVRAET